jgi:predicted permease
MDTFLQDLRYALRGLARERSLTVFIAATFALGIGVNTAVGPVLNRLVLEGPRHVDDADRVFKLFGTVGGGPFPLSTGGAFGYVTYAVLDESSSFEVAAYTTSTSSTFGEGADAARLNIEYATADLFTVLGVEPQLGRFFTAAEDDPNGAQQVAVLSDGFWRRELGGDPAAIGRTIELSGNSFTVVGVALPGFTGPELGRVDVWLPQTLTSRNVTGDWTTSWNAQWLQIVVRPRPGVSVERVNEEATAIRTAAFTGNDEVSRVARLTLRPLTSNGRGEEPGEVAISRWLAGVAVLVLAIACANIANLLLARALRRRREIAVRFALGAARTRVARLLVIEGVLLALLGAVASLAVAYGVTTFIQSALLPNIEWSTAPLAGPVLLLSIAIAAVVGLFVGIVPALRMTRPDLASPLATGVREGGGQAQRLRAALTVAQAALCTVLLVGAGLFSASLSRVRSLDLGLEPDRTLLASVVWAPIPFGTPGAARDAEVARRDEVLRQAWMRLGAAEGVERSGLTIGLPFVSGYRQELRVDGMDSIPFALGRPSIAAVTEGYFETVGMRMARGRAFTRGDGAGTEPVAIVNETMAQRLWPDRDPLGECLYTGREPTPCSRIVGIVRDARRNSLVEDPGMMYYVPLGQHKQMGGMSLVVRPTGPLQPTIAALGGVVRDLDPTVLYVGGELLARRIDPQTRGWRMGAIAFGLLAGLALAVAAVGLYSVMSYLVAQRTHEIGVRLALGATAASIAGLVVRSGVGLAALGVGLGAAAALGLGRFLEPLLFQTSPRDLTTFAAVCATLLCVAALASLLPALRARRISPLEALRGE